MSDLATLGRERIPGRPGEGGRTILVAITDDESYPLRCPRCAQETAELGTPGQRPELLTVDDDGTASCPGCGLAVPSVLPEMDP